MERFERDREREEIIILANQVRALVCLGQKNFHPLLLEVAADQKIELNCFGPRDLREYPSFIMEAKLFHRPDIIDINPRERWVKYKFSDWLDSKIIILNCVIYTPNEILRAKADTEASHYDPVLSKKLEALKRIERSLGEYNLSEPDFYVLQVARIVSSFGAQFKV